MSLYESLIRPLAFLLPAETAHDAGSLLLRSGLGFPPLRRLVGSRSRRVPQLPVSRFGLEFPNPLGVAAGFDKNGKMVRELAALGFGFVEVGTVTLRPQPGNPKPRLFRLARDRALINRLGFNNDGAAKVAERLGAIDAGCVVGVNIGRNKDVANEDAAANYLETFRVMHPVADYIAVNVSSPNTPGLRELQSGSHLDRLLDALMNCNAGMRKQKPLLLKIAPDLGQDQLEEIVRAAERNSLSGLIATNTSVGREGLAASSSEIKKIGNGGLSGRPLFRRSTDILRRVADLSDGGLPVIGVGGIFTGDDAFEKIAAGASLVQAYTGFVYLGPGFPNRVNRRLGQVMEDQGFSSVDDVAGTAAEGPGNAEREAARGVAESAS